MCLHIILCTSINFCSIKRHKKREIEHIISAMQLSHPFDHKQCHGGWLKILNHAISGIDAVIIMIMPTMRAFFLSLIRSALNLNVKITLTTHKS